MVELHIYRDRLPHRTVRQPLANHVSDAGRFLQTADRDSRRDSFDHASQNPARTSFRKGINALRVHSFDRFDPANRFVRQGIEADRSPRGFEGQGSLLRQHRNSGRLCTAAGRAERHRRVVVVDNRHRVRRRIHWTYTMTSDWS